MRDPVTEELCTSLPRRRIKAPELCASERTRGNSKGLKPGFTPESDCKHLTETDIKVDQRRGGMAHLSAICQFIQDSVAAVQSFGSTYLSI